MRDHPLRLLPSRTAMALTRRSSLFVLAGLGFTTQAGFDSAAAGKASKQAKKRCKRQVGQCESALAPTCTYSQIAVSEAECLALILPCCQEFGDCQAGAAFACLQEASQTMAPPPP